MISNNIVTVGDDQSIHSIDMGVNNEGTDVINEVSDQEVKELALLDHNSVLNALLNELGPVDFHRRAGLESGESTGRKHFLIISNEEILEIAKKNKWSLCMSDGVIYAYNGSFWKQLMKDTLLKFLGEGALKLGVDCFEAKHFRFRQELYQQFLSTAYLPRPEKKGNEVIINLKNGTFVISPESQFLKQFDRDDFLTYRLDFNYDPDKAAPLFEKYLNRVLPDLEQQQILAEYVAYVFVKQKTLKLEKTLILFGSGANGKSVFFEIINAMLGKENVSNFSLKSLTDENGYFRAKLSDKLLNYASEISPKMDSTFFKQLVSGEPIEARLPYKEPFLITDYAKFIFNTNMLPKDVEQNEAFFRRFILIHFSVTIPEEERDATLASRIITDEMEGVFNWVLQGLKRLLENKKFTHSEIVAKAIEEYRQQSDSVYLFLDEENYTQDHIGEIPLRVIFELYRNYCESCGYKSCSRKVFADRLRGLKYPVIRKSFGNVVGIRKKDLEVSAYPTSDTLNCVAN